MGIGGLNVLNTKLRHQMWNFKFRNFRQKTLLIQKNPIAQPPLSEMTLITVDTLLNKILLIFIAGLGSQDEVDLVDFLFTKSNYNQLIRPVANISDSLAVQFSLAISQLINMVQ